MASTGASAELLVVGLGADRAARAAPAAGHRHGDRLRAGRPGSPRRGRCGSRPVLPYGSCGEHAGFAGTLSIGQRGARARARRTRSLVRRAGAVRLRARRATWSRCARAAERRERPRLVPALGGDAHAGRVETSLMLALAPERVGPERPVGNTAPLASLMPALRSAGVRAVSAERRPRRRHRRLGAGGPGAAQRGDRGADRLRRRIRSARVTRPRVSGPRSRLKPRPRPARHPDGGGAKRVALVTGAARGIGAATSSGSRRRVPRDRDRRVEDDPRLAVRARDRRGAVRARQRPRAAIGPTRPTPSCSRPSSDRAALGRARRDRRRGRA